MQARNPKESIKRQKVFHTKADELKQGNNEIKVQSERQIYNYTASLRRKDGSHLNYDELSRWCSDHYILPNDT